VPPLEDFAMPTYRNLLPGDPAPWFRQRSSVNPNYAFDSAAGRYLVLCFFLSAANARARAALDAIALKRFLFNDEKAAFFGVSIDPADEQHKRVATKLPGYRYFWDGDSKVSKLYGAVPVDGLEPGATARQLWVVLDPTLRILKVVPFREDGSSTGEVLSFLEQLPPPARFAGFEIQAPVLVLPNVFEGEFCERLIALYEADGGQESGFMREKDGKTVVAHDPGHKRRKDYEIIDTEVIKHAQNRVIRRVAPEILKVHQFQVSRMERYIVSCYAEEDGGHFAPHRDNTTKGTAHRRFAVSINLNADFDGGEVSFPEYSSLGLKPPPGGVVVFSCSLLHTVSKVRRGRRYAFLPFLYDEVAAKLREANNAFLGEDVGAYRP
jgi:predicted 2-oxoglutarate/Fe(II)-dependent dioxygenase YbiX/peroxiredoxin